MNNCKYLIETNDGNFLVEVPSFSNSASEYDFKQAFYNYLSNIDIKEFVSSLKSIDKQLVIPENIKGTILGQDSLESVSENFKDVNLKNKFRFLSKTLTKYWKDSLREQNIKNPSKNQNIVFCAFDETIDYLYDKEKDIVFINTVNGVNKEDILRASLERTAYLITKESNIKNKLKSLDTNLLSSLGINEVSTITLDDVNKLYFNQSDIQRKSIEGFLAEKRESYKIIREKYEPLLEERDKNYEPANAEFIYDLKPGDLVNILVDKEISKNKKSSTGYYALLVDYFINQEGKYVMKVISSNSTYPESVVLDTPEVIARKQSINEKYASAKIDGSGKYFPIKIPKELYFNNKFIYNFLKPEDKITLGKSDYMIINLKGALFNVVDSKGQETIIKPGNEVTSVKLSSVAHPELTLSSITNDFKKVSLVKNSDKAFIQELDIVKYGDDKTGLVLYKVSNIFFVKNLSSGEVESISDVSIREHYINNVGNKKLIESFNSEAKSLINVNPFVYSDWFSTDHNWVQYYEGYPLKKGDYIILDNKVMLVVDLGRDLFRIYDGERYNFIESKDLLNAVITTKRKQDPELSKISINKNSYYVSNNPDEYSSSYPVKVIFNKNTGATRVVSVEEPLKEYHIDKTSEVKKEKGFKEGDQLYAFKNKKGIVIKNSESSIPVYDADTKFKSIFDDMIPGTFIKFFNEDLKYWLIEKRVKEDFLISHSFISNGEIRTVKKLLTKNDLVSEVRLPSYATSVLKKMNGVKNSLELVNEVVLKEYDTPMILSGMKDLLYKKFGININLVHTSDVDEQNASSRAFVLNGEYYVNIDKASISDPLHEFLHVVLASMKYTNLEQYNLLVQSVEKHPLFKEVSKVYKEINSDILEETFIRLFSDTVSNKILHQGIFTEEVFNSAVKEGITEMFDLSRSLADEYGLELMNMELKDVLIGFGSKLIEGSESLYDKEKANTMIKASTIMRKLIKNGNLKEECNGSL